MRDLLAALRDAAGYCLWRLMTALPWYLGRDPWPGPRNPRRSLAWLHSGEFALLGCVGRHAYRNEPPIADCGDESEAPF
jgi:hypothetical protein